MELTLNNWLDRFLHRIVTGCAHTGYPLPEGRSHCPHCQQAVVARWVVLQCDGCQRPRPARFDWLGRPQTRQAHCAHCDTPTTTLTLLNNPPYYKLTHALLIITPDGPPRLHTQASLSPLKCFPKPAL